MTELSSSCHMFMFGGVQTIIRLLDQLSVVHAPQILV